MKEEKEDCMQELEPPKPTKEFHEMYEEIYGKKKKREETLKREHLQEGEQKNSIDDLDKLDIPPIKLIPYEKKYVPVSLEKEKKGFFSGLFGKKRKKEENSKFPPLEIENLNLPLLDLHDHNELVDGEPVDTTTFSKDEKLAMDELEKLDTPPKQLTIEPFPELSDIKTDRKKERKIHDFLAEIKGGARRKEEEKEFHIQTSFEKEKVEEGAGDFTPAFKKQWKALKEYEQNVKKTIIECNKKQVEVQTWIKNQQIEEKNVEKKVQKLHSMEQKLHQKQQNIVQYEPKMRELRKKEDDIDAKESALKKKHQDLKETESRIRTEEDAIVAKIKKLEADQKLLEKEEDALSKTVAQLDKERVAITSKTLEFAKIVKDISNAEKELKEKAQILDDREARIKKKEKLVEIEFNRIEKLKKTAERLKNVEETYTRMKERLREAYKEYEKKFANQQAYAPQEIQSVTIQPTFLPVRTMQESRAVDSGDITNLITATKQLIMEKHYDEANKNLNRLMSRYMQIPDNNPRKKEIYYEIVGLKNMLKLDLLE